MKSGASPASLNVNWFTPDVLLSPAGRRVLAEQFSDADLVSMTKDYYQKMYIWSFTKNEQDSLC